MNLIIDIGNTNIKLGLFNSLELEKVIITKNINKQLIDDIFRQFIIEKIIISKVGKELSDGIKSFLESKNIQIIYLSFKTKLPIHNNYQTPKTLGQDRIAGVIGGYELKNPIGTLVIDAGTCITYDFITKEGVYLGGSISPGLSMRFKAMNEFTVALPLLNKQRLNTFVGYNTETSMITGVQSGLTFEIQGFIEEYINKYGQIKVIMTGGDAVYLASLLKNKIFVSAELVLIGLNKILNYNAKFLE